MSDGAEQPAPAVVRQELGTLEVAEQVFRGLAMQALSEVGGVAGVGRAGGLFRRRSAEQALAVERGEGEVAFSIHLSVRYDVRIPDLVEKLRRRVRAAVEDATGYKVRAISVTVEHILPPEEPPPLAPPELPKGTASEERT